MRPASLCADRRISIRSALMPAFRAQARRRRCPPPPVILREAPTARHRYTRQPVRRPKDLCPKRLHASLTHQAPCRPTCHPERGAHRKASLRQAARAPTEGSLSEAPRSLPHTSPGIEKPLHHACSSGATRPGYRSTHCGFRDSISAAFFSRTQPLICFSRAIAASTWCVCSK
jgi:hypothetical protein